MADPLAINPTRTALLVMDYQEAIVAMAGPAGEAALNATTRVLAAARAAGMPVIYVVVGFRAGYPEVSLRNRSFGALRESGRFSPGAPGLGIHSAVAPGPSEVVVTKHRVSAFAGTDLEMILRAKEIQTLLLCGISTSGVILSTVRHAADADYGLLVVEDGCADMDPTVHEVLIRKVYPRQATVVTSQAVIQGLPPKA